MTDEPVAAIESGSVVLGSGTLRLVDIRLPQDGEAARIGQAWLLSLHGQVVRVGRVGEADRWGRTPALVSLPGNSAIDVAELLVGEGLAFVDAGMREQLCRPGLLAIEAAARQRKLGVWGGDLPLASQDRQALGAAAGRFVVIEGRIVSVGERRERTYLNFGRDWSADLAATIPRRTWTSMLARGLSSATLTGARVRIRGVLEARRAPTLDIVSPDMLEVIAPGRARSDKE